MAVSTFASKSFDESKGQQTGRRPRYPVLSAGFHLLVAYWIAASFFPTQGLSFQKIAVTLLLYAALACFFLSFWSRRRATRHYRFSKQTRMLLALFLGWCVIAIARGVDADAGRLFTLLGNPEVGGLVWLLPFAIYLGREPETLGALIPTFRVHAALGIILTSITIFSIAFAGASPKEVPEKIGLSLLYGAPFVLLSGYGRALDRRLYVVGLLLASIAHYYLSNRASLALSLGFLAIFLAIRPAKSFSRLSTRLTVLAMTVVVTGTLASDLFMSWIDETWFIDTRTFLWEEMSNDFSVYDWVFGRGALGSYFSPHFEAVNRSGGEGDWMYRQVNEIGYLHVALKTGLIGVALYVLTVLRAAYEAFRIQDKRLAFAVLVLLTAHLSEMLVIGQASFLPERVFLWMLVGFAFAESGRHRANRLE